jgi:hypothetical protein
VAQNKTRPSQQAAEDFIAAVENPQRQADSHELLALMSEVTGEKATMWGPSLIGFGQYHYKYASGREGDFFLTGFSPRKQSMTIYIMPGFDFAPDLMASLGKYKTGKSCLYISKLDDVDRDILKQLVEASVAYMREKYPD